MILEFQVWCFSFVRFWSYKLPNVVSECIIEVYVLLDSFPVKQLSVRFLQHFEAPAYHQGVHSVGLLPATALVFQCCSCLPTHTRLHPANRTYISYVYMEYTYNNSVLRTFVKLLQDAVKERRKRTRRGRGGGGSVVHTGLLENSSVQRRLGSSSSDEDEGWSSPYSVSPSSLSLSLNMGKGETTCPKETSCSED